MLKWLILVVINLFFSEDEQSWLMCKLLSKKKISNEVIESNEEGTQPITPLVTPQHHLEIHSEEPEPLRLHVDISNVRITMKKDN